MQVRSQHLGAPARVVVGDLLDVGRLVAQAGKQPFHLLPIGETTWQGRVWVGDVRSRFHAEKTARFRLSPMGLMDPRPLVGRASLHPPAIDFDARQLGNGFHARGGPRQRLIGVRHGLSIALVRQFFAHQNRQVVDLTTGDIDLSDQLQQLRGHVERLRQAAGRDDPLQHQRAIPTPVESQQGTLREKNHAHRRGSDKQVRRT